MPNVTWLKNGIPLQPDLSVVLTANNGLLFKHVSIQDMANYTCVAENLAGRRTSDPADLTIFVDGSWSSWGTWTECKCSGKLQGQKRSRTCTSPSPINGGAPCGGPNTQKTQDCIACPSKYNFFFVFLNNLLCN